MLEYSLGNVSASPEFDFPLQLIYQTQRPQEGLFGSGWFCPQFESSILPSERGYLIWTMPSGDQIGLEQDPKQSNEYRSRDRLWVAKIASGTYIVANEEGWEYHYLKGKMTTVISPTRRVLELDWDQSHLPGITFYDTVSHTRRAILEAIFGANKRLASIKLDGQIHRFAYVQDGRTERLAAWGPPVGETMKFLYQPDSGVLGKVGTGDTRLLDRTEEFKTQFVAPPRPSDAPATEAAIAADELSAKKNPGNYWLMEDRLRSYSYGPIDAKSKRWNPADITVKYRNGLIQKTVLASSRGTVTNEQNGAIRKDYYYCAPGQKYDGKLRRVEINDKLILENRYSRKTGLLTETVDEKNVSTYYDYDPKIRPYKIAEWEPKPLRIRRGNRQHSEVIAQYAYREDGKLIAAKDAQGEITSYVYNPRGEIATISTSMGDKVSYTYDVFGKCNSTSSGGRTEKVEFDKSGRLKSQIAANGARTEINYDEAGQLSEVKRDGKVTKQLVRDEFKRVIGEKDALGRFSRIERDARGNLTSQLAPNGAITRYEYDVSDRRTAQIDGNGNKIRFAYDPAGHLIEQTNALGNVMKWAYDGPTGKLTHRSNSLQTISYNHDPSGQLSATDYGTGQQLSYAYDKESRPISISGPDSAFECSYDSQNRITATRATCDGEDYLLSYRYNRRGQRSGLLISAFVPKTPAVGETPSKPGHYQPLQQTEQVFDPEGRLTQILSNGVPAISYRYDSLNRPIQKTYGAPENGKPALTADIGYDSAGHLARMEFKGGNLTAPLLLSYEWDSADQLTRRLWNGQKLSYQYDGSGQLLQVIDDQDKSLLEAYSYDLAGNMLTKLVDGQLTAMTYNAANQLENSYDLGPADPKTQATLPRAAAALAPLAKSTLTYQYDKAGRMLGTSGITENTYGWLDKVTARTLPDGTKITTRYWPDGQVARINSDSTSTTAAIPAIPATRSSETLLWDGLALIKRGETIYIIESHPSGGIPIASHPIGRSNEITYHLNDLLGTTLATSGPEGTRFSRLTSFGQPLLSPTGSLGLTNPSPPSITNPIPPTQQLPRTKK
jgi:YD repeat-containing protein